MIKAILFDVGDTLVETNPPATPTEELDVRPRGPVARELQALRRSFMLGAVTDTTVMTGPDVRHLLGPSGIAAALDVIVTSVDVGAAKPDPTGLNRACAQLGVDPADALFVGDADRDRQAALAAGTEFVLVQQNESAGTAVRRWFTDHHGAFVAADLLVGPLDAAAARSARDHQDRLTKPRGALGRLEDLSIQLAAIAGTDPPPIPRPAAAAIFAGDHGVHAQGVTPWPQEVTAQMVANFVAGGAAINVLARQTGATVTVVDVGVATELLSDGPNLWHHRVRNGTADLSTGPAMSPDEVTQALDIGVAVANQLVQHGARLLITGEMGIGNTTPAAALIAAFTHRPAAEVTGRGTGIDDATLATKIAVIDRALERLERLERLDHADARTVLAQVGGLEHAALAGFIIGGASHRIPVIVDGVIAGAALLAATRLNPLARDYAIAGHRSTEPGASVVLEELNLEPVLDLGMRLGEGSGACLALPIVQAAAATLQEMATFDAAGVSQKSLA